jgi:hypothetical protein
MHPSAIRTGTAGPCSSCPISLFNQLPVRCQPVEKPTPSKMELAGGTPGAPGALGLGESMKKAGEVPYSGPARGRKEKDHKGTRGTEFQHRSPSSIAILPVRCKENPLRPGRGGEHEQGAGERSREVKGDLRPQSPTGEVQHTCLVLRTCKDMVTNVLDNKKPGPGREG